METTTCSQVLQRIYNRAGNARYEEYLLMKVTKLQLQKIIQEEIQQAIDEGFLDRAKARARGGAAAVKTLPSRVAGMGAQGVGKAIGIVDPDRGQRLTQKGIDIEQSAKEKVSAAKIYTVMDAALQALIKDLEKLGIAVEGDILNSVSSFKKAVEREATKAGYKGWKHV